MSYDRCVSKRTRYQSIGLTVKAHLSDKEQTVAHILSILGREGITVYVDRHSVGDLYSAKHCADLSENVPIDALLVIGGDGTILRSVRELRNFAVPIVSVKKGAVGFLAEINIDEADSLLPWLLSGEGVLEQRSLLSVSVLRSGGEIFHAFALNEAVISQGTISRLLDLRTKVGGEMLANFHADGLIIATPTGSTAYSLAAGGPIVHPRIGGLILTPINPHSFNQRPIVLPGHADVESEVTECSDNFSESSVSLTIDGQVYFPLQRFDRVNARIHSEAVTFIRRSEDTFFHTLRTKLKWGER